MLGYPSAQEILNGGDRRGHPLGTGSAALTNEPETKKAELLFICGRPHFEAEQISRLQAVLLGGLDF